LIEEGERRLENHKQMTRSPAFLLKGSFMPFSGLFLETFREWVDLYMHHSMRSFFRFARDHGLSMPQIGTLFQLQRRGTWAVFDVSKSLNVTSAAASQMIDRLVQQELVTRSEDPADRRSKRIALTEKGHQLVKDSIQARQIWLAELDATLTAEEKEQVGAALKLLIEKARLLEKDSTVDMPDFRPEEDERVEAKES
jgi:DNA-binding MarR family transcriptional regulator